MDRFKLTETFSLKDPICATFFERDDIKTLIWPTTGMAVELHVFGSVEIGRKTHNLCLPTYDEVS